jgi:xanthine/uracil permease
LLAWRKYANEPWRTILILVGAIIVSSSFIVFSNQDSRDFFTNWSIITAASAALSLSIIAVITAYKRRIDRFFVYAQIIFTIGLALWLVAEVTWAYYQLVLEIGTPFPSSADAFWLSGYGFFIYFMFRIYNFLNKGNEKFIAVLVSVATAIILGYILNLTFGIADLSSAQEGSLAWLISIAYPILDGILLVPAVLILWSLRGKNVASANWSLLALSIVLVTVGDIGFGYSAVIDKAGKDEWIWDLFYNSSYLAMAAAFFLQSKVFAKEGHTKIIVQK